MKRSILFLAALFIINAASAQSYFGYCVAQLNGHTYVSEVVDITKLPADNINRVSPMGPRKLIEYYDEVARHWFAKQMIKNNLDPSNCPIMAQLSAGVEMISKTCKTGNEAACFCVNMKVATDQRRKFLSTIATPTVLK